MKFAHTLVAVVIACTPALASVVVHDITGVGAFEGTALPSGYTENLSGAGTITYDYNASGAARFLTPGVATGDTRLITSSAGLTAADGWSAEISFQVSAIGEAGELQIIVRSGLDVPIWITNNGIYGGIATVGDPIFTGTDLTDTFHTLIVVYDPLDVQGSGDPLRFWLDGTESTATWAGNGASGSDQIIFGDSNSGIDDADSLVNYAYFSSSAVAVPEPSTSFLVGLVGLGAIARRRRENLHIQ